MNYFLSSDDGYQFNIKFINKKFIQQRIFGAVERYGLLQKYFLNYIEKLENDLNASGIFSILTLQGLSLILPI